jgi:hypothetical protein
MRLPRFAIPLLLLSVVVVGCSKKPSSLTAPVSVASTLSQPGGNHSGEHDSLHVEFTGTITAISGSVLTVAGRTVVTDTSTEFRRERLGDEGGEGGDDFLSPGSNGDGEHGHGHGGDGEGGEHITLADLTVGDTVRVEGKTQPDGSVLAREVTLLTTVPGPQQDCIEGAVASVDASARTFVIGTQTVHVTDATRFHEHSSFTDIVVGANARACGQVQADGSLLATSVRVGGEGEGDDDQGDDSTHGPGGTHVSGTGGAERHR